MGYISSSTTVTLNVQLTDEGRSRILQAGNFVNLFDKFGISDGDIDYRNTQKHADTNSTSNDSAQLGFIPEVTGNLTNFRKAVNNGYKLNNSVWATPENSVVLSSPKTYVAIGMKQTNDSVKYYRDNVEIDVYLHDYYVLNKLLACRYISDHNDVLSKFPTTIVGDVETYFKDTLEVRSDSDYLKFLNTLSEFGVSQYIDFWDSVKVYDGSTLKTENIKLVPDKDFGYYNALALAGGAYIGNGGRGEHNGIDFVGTNLKGVRQASPFSIMISPGLNTDANMYKTGAGNAGIGFEAFDVGYINAGGVSVWNATGESYPTFTMNNKSNGWSTEVQNIKDVFVGFVTSVDMETAVSTENEGFGNVGYNNINTTIPTTRLVLNVATNDLSPTYYPIKLKRLTRQNGDYVNINGVGAKGINITDTTHPSDTFGLLGGSMEYSSSWNKAEQGFKSGAPYFNLYPSKDSGMLTESTKVGSLTDPYYTLSTRMMKMADDIFVGIAAQNNSYWMTDTYSGGFKSGLSGSSVSEYNVSIPITWNVYSTESPSAAPCKVTVRFKFNKKAVKQSLQYTNMSSQNSYRLYDTSTFKFYGEDGATLASHSTDPRGDGYTTGSTNTWRTSDGKSLFRKLTSGQEI